MEGYDIMLAELIKHTIKQISHKVSKSKNPKTAHHSNQGFQFEIVESKLGLRFER